MLRISLPKQILLAILIGLGLGIFLGPICSIFEPIGTTYVMFIQMVILLYIPSSIIHGLGSTRPTVARQLFKKGGFFLLFIWALVYLTLFLMNFLFPKSEVVISAQSAEHPLEHNFLSYLVPENPIYDLANNIVPAIAIFGIIIGIALMHLTHKEPLISLLERVNTTIEKILKGIMVVSPLGVLAITAYVSGTIRWDDIEQFGFYLIPLISIVLILMFWALPALITSFTPLTYRDIVKEFRVPCLLAFLIGSPSIAIPFLSDSIKKHAEKFKIKDKELHNTSQMIVPIAYTFTQVGNLLILFFIMYLSFSFQRELNTVDQVLVSILTLPMSFGGPELAINSISFLTEKLGFPDAAMYLYNRSSIISQNFQVLLSVATMVTFVILFLLAYYQRLSFRFARFFKHFFLFFFLLIVSTLGIKMAIQEHMPDQNPAMQMSMKVALPQARPAKVYKPGDPLPQDSKREAISDPMERIFKTHSLFIGYHPSLPPFSYFNEEGELVGYNIAYAYKLALDTGMDLVFIPFSYSNLAEYLSKNIIDIAAAPVLLSSAASQDMNFPHYYMKTPNVLITSRSRREEFLNFKRLQDNPYLVIGAVGFFKEIVHHIFPKAEVVELTNIDEINPYLSEGKVDAVLWTKEVAISYCKAHRDYVTMEYGEEAGGAFLAYPVKFEAFALIFFLNRWLTILEEIKFNTEQYNYWMLGQPPTQKTPRWSVYRNIFHWERRD